VARVDFDVLFRSEQRKAGSIDRFAFDREFRAEHSEADLAFEPGIHGVIRGKE